MNPRTDWVKPKPDLPLTPERLAELKESVNEYEGVVQMYSRVLDHFQREVFSKRKQPVKAAKLRSIK